MNEIKTQGLVKDYRGRCVVNEVSLNVAQGEVIGLLAPMVLEKQPHFI